MANLLEAKTQKLYDTLSSAMEANIYISPPSSIRMTYPAIIITLSSMSDEYANNNKYKRHVRFNVTFITKTVNDVNVNFISSLKHCTLSSAYVSDNLYHYVFNITM